MMNLQPTSSSLKVFPQKKSEARQECLFFLFLVNIPLEVLARAIRQEKEIEDIQIRKCIRYFSTAVRKYSDKK